MTKKLHFVHVSAPALISARLDVTYELSKIPIMQMSTFGLLFTCDFHVDRNENYSRESLNSHYTRFVYIPEVYVRLIFLTYAHDQCEHHEIFPDPQNT